MKRLLAFLMTTVLSASFALMLCACGSNEDEDQIDPNSEGYVEGWDYDTYENVEAPAADEPPKTIPDEE